VADADDSRRPRCLVLPCRHLGMCCVLSGLCGGVALWSRWHLRSQVKAVHVCSRICFELADVLLLAGIAVDGNGSVLIADHGNNVLRRLRPLRAAQVKAKLRKMLEDMKKRGMRQCFSRWVSNLTVYEAMEPLEVVLLLALATLNIARSPQQSPLLAFNSGSAGVTADVMSSDGAVTSVGTEGSKVEHEEHSLPRQQVSNASRGLRAVVEAVAKVLGWRVVKTRQTCREEAREPADGAPEGDRGGGGRAELAERIEEARRVFLEYDTDGGGSIDAAELKAALDATDMVVTDEEVLELLKQYDPDGSGDIGFDEFCLMQVPYA